MFVAFARLTGLEFLRSNEQLRGPDVQSVRDLADVRVARVAIAALYAAEIRPVHAAEVGELLLGDPLPCPKVANGCAEGGVCSRALRHGSETLAA